MSEPTFNRWGVKSATLTFGGATYEMEVGKAGQDENRPSIDVTALNDNVKRFIKGALKELGTIPVTLYQKASGNITSDASPAALTLSITLENGIDADQTVSVTINRAIVEDVKYPDEDATGDRKATYTVEFRPDGSPVTGNAG